MKLEAALCGFLNRVRDDPRIGPSHISLYVAIIFSFAHQKFNIATQISSKVLMRQAKISSKVTYYKCIKDLKEAGYIRYLPSYDPALGSLIYLNKLTE